MKLSNSLPTIDDGALHAILEARHGDPFAVLGLHQSGEQLVVRVFRPDARAVTVRSLENPRNIWPAVQVHPDGLFQATLEGVAHRVPYELEFTAHNGHLWIERDPYSFATILGPLDLHLFGEGQHWELYKKLGAHIVEVDGVRAPPSTFGRRMPSASRSSETSTNGMVAGTR
jgi:1,4-alpha-glucan branching enzyme